LSSSFDDQPAGKDVFKIKTLQLITESGSPALIKNCSFNKYMKALPLIVTLKLEESAQALFNGLREKHFPKHCNYMDAHLTLFHHLPSDNPFISKTLTSFANRPTMELDVAAIKNIGNGVAYAIESQPLKDMHRKMQKSFDRVLIPQDQKRIWPHITIQNKVTAYKALLTTTELQQDFKPFRIHAVGLSSWLYLGAAWEWVGDEMFVESGSKPGASN
jgi:hypothetical protein